MKNNPRKPLIVIAPKSLLRHPMATSPVDELMNGRFEPVLLDVATSPDVKRVIITSGNTASASEPARQKASRRGCTRPVKRAAVVEAYRPGPRATAARGS